MSINRLDQRGVLGPSLSSLPSVSSIFRDDRLWYACQASVSGHQNFLKYHPQYLSDFSSRLASVHNIRAYTARCQSTSASFNLRRATVDELQFACILSISSVIKKDKWSAADVGGCRFSATASQYEFCLLGESECGYLNDGDDERLSFIIFPNLVVWRKNQASFFFLNDPFFLYIMPASMHGQSGTALSSGPFGCKMPYVPVRRPEGHQLAAVLCKNCWLLDGILRIALSHLVGSSLRLTA
ncbi:hypothetical protein T10_13089 [Trichinella papuae]|uniref:Uncharacterized protein n=1 Tax=Trichinella papuae TaxID=268474 RepID=A0A0V1MFG0_9BILA|nr:hypothetical protein T10_13089 [Trichinella papuae]